MNLKIILSISVRKNLAGVLIEIELHLLRSISDSVILSNSVLGWLVGQQWLIIQAGQLPHSGKHPFITGEDKAKFQIFKLYLQSVSFQTASRTFLWTKAPLIGASGRISELSPCRHLRDRFRCCLAHSPHPGVMF